MGGRNLGRSVELSPLSKRLLSTKKPSDTLTPSQVGKTLKGRIHKGSAKAFVVNGYKPIKSFRSEAEAIRYATQMVASYDRFSDGVPDSEWIILGRMGSSSEITVFTRSAPALDIRALRATPTPAIQNRLTEVMSRRSQLFRDMDRLEQSGIGDRVWAELAGLNKEKAVLETALEVKG